MTARAEAQTQILVIGVRRTAQRLHGQVIVACNAAMVADFRPYGGKWRVGRLREKNSPARGDFMRNVALNRRESETGRVLGLPLKRKKSRSVIRRHDPAGAVTARWGLSFRTPRGSRSPHDWAVSKNWNRAQSEDKSTLALTLSNSPKTRPVNDLDEPRDGPPRCICSPE
jgi:hypothetical protein